MRDGLRKWPIGTPKQGEHIRPFQREDWIGKRLHCPCHGILHRVIDAHGPYLGNDPSEGNREDFYWVLRLSDGGDARMWEDRKGVIVPDATPRSSDQQETP